MINDLEYYNKMNVNNMLDYPSESDTCSEIQSLEEIMDIIGKSNVDDEVEDDTIPLEPITCNEHLSHLELFTILRCSSKRQHWSS